VIVPYFSGASVAEPDYGLAHCDDRSYLGYTVGYRVAPLSVGYSCFHLDFVRVGHAYVRVCWESQ
ncbi:MAG: hypothetical protein WB795_04340, partial [Candidatus Acidiferrales bacterium]